VTDDDLENSFIFDNKLLNLNYKLRALSNFLNIFNTDSSYINCGSTTICLHINIFVVSKDRDFIFGVQVDGSYSPSQRMTNYP